MVFWLVPNKKVLNPRGQALCKLETRETESCKGWHGVPILEGLIVRQNQIITTESIHQEHGFCLYGSLL